MNFDVKCGYAPATLSQRPLVRSAILSPLDTTTIRVETSATTFVGDMGRRLAQELKKVMRLRLLEVRHIFPFIIVIPPTAFCACHVHAIIFWPTALTDEHLKFAVLCEKPPDDKLSVLSFSRQQWNFK